MPTLTRSDAFAALADLGSRFDRTFEELNSGRYRAWTSAINVACEDDDVVARAEWPGLGHADVKFELGDGVLTVSVEYKEPEVEADKEYARRERCDGSLPRSPDSMPRPSRDRRVMASPWSQSGMPRLRRRGR
jgi:HSP20 family molecular chaperone IbpA